MPTKTDQVRIFSTGNGAFYCIKHLGYTARAFIEGDPKGGMWDTMGPDGLVVEMTAPGNIEIVEAEGALDTLVCEECVFAA